MNAAAVCAQRPHAFAAHHVFITRAER